MTKPMHGIWIDDPVRDVLTGDFWDKMVDHGLSTGAIMLEGLGDGFDSSYSVETLQKIKALALARDIEVVLTTWPEPNQKYMKDFEEQIEDLLDAAGATALEFDLEGNWLPIKVSGYANLDVAGDAFVAMFQRVSARLDVRTECTTYPFHTENNKMADVAPHCDRLLPQAYSVSERSDREVPWDSAYGPGRMQVLTMDRALAVRGVGTTSGPLISCGLAAYEQRFGGRAPEEAMRVAYLAACHYEPVEVRWWSSKHVFGVKANPYASKFIKSIK